jgi:hypothetical protein
MHMTVDSDAKGGTKDLLAANAKESVELAEAFLSVKFLDNQAKFLESKGKTGPAMAFKIMVATRPLWNWMT